MRDIVVVSVVLVAALIGFRRPAFGMMVFVFFGFLNPQSYTWGFARTFPLSQVLAVSTIAGMFVFPERRKFALQRETVLLILLWVTFGWSTIFALDQEVAVQNLIFVSKILLMIVVAIVVINSEERIYSLIRIIGYSLGFYGLKAGVFAVLSGGNFLVYGPENTFLETNNSIGLALAMNLPVLLYLLKREQLPWVRWIVRAMLVFSYPAIICTYSRGAWLGMVTVTAVNALKSRQRLLIVPMAGLAAMILLPLLPAIAPDRLARRYDSLVNYEEETSAQSRFWNWEFCRRVGFARPLTGGGFKFYRPSVYAEYYPEYLERWPGKFWSCHSAWLTIFGEHGLPGTVVWLLLLGCSLMSLKTIRKSVQLLPKKSHYAALVDMIQGSLVAYFVVGTFFDAAYFDMFYYVLAIIIIMKGIVQENIHTEYLSSQVGPRIIPRAAQVVLCR